MSDINWDLESATLCSNWFVSLYTNNKDWAMMISARFVLLK